MVVVDRGLEELIHDGFKIAHDGDWRPWMWPREPSEYVPTDHFRNRFNDPKRHLTGERINEAITNGELLPAIGRKALFRIEESGVSFNFVAAYNPEKDQNYVVTGYPFLVSKTAAADSSQWEHSDISGFETLTRGYLGKDSVQQSLAEKFDLKYNPDTLKFDTEGSTS